MYTNMMIFNIQVLVTPQKYVQSFGIGLDPDSAMLQDIDCNLFKVNTIEDLFCFVLCFLLHSYCLSDTHHLLLFTARL